MSSSRSVASARARRASENPQPTLKPSQQVKPSSQQSQYQSKTNNGEPQMKPFQPQQSSIENKLSVSDAFALVTIRLGRLELLVQKWQAAGVNPGSGAGTTAPLSTDTNNNTLVKSLVSRMDDLERDVKAGVSSAEFDDELTILSNQYAQLQTELREAKDTIFKLQMMTLDTSQKIMNMMMSKGSVVPDVAKKEEPSETTASASVTSETNAEALETETQVESA